MKNHAGEKFDLGRIAGCWNMTGDGLWLCLRSERSICASVDAGRNDAGKIVRWEIRVSVHSMLAGETSRLVNATNMEAAVGRAIEWLSRKGK